MASVELREFIELQIEYLEKLIDERSNHIQSITDVKLQAMDKATLVAYQQMESRLSGMNEFRQSLNDQTKEFVNKAAFNAFKDSTEKSIQSLELTRAEMKGMATQTSVNRAMLFSVIGTIFGGIGILISVLSILKELGTP